MSRAPESSAFPAGRFRLKLMVAMMLVVSGITALAVYLAERNLAVATGQELQREFRLELEALHRVHALREAALLERCRALVRKPRIHAAFEDDALDLLYPSARDELRDIMDSPDTGNDNAAYALRAEFYRFLGRDGGLLAPDAESHAGVLRPAEEAQLRLPVLPDKPQFGFLRSGMEPDAEIAAEIIAMPIISWETDRPIAALILGFRPVALDDGSTGSGIRRGLWLDGRLHMRGLSTAERAAFTACMAAAMDSNPAASDDGGEACDVEGRMHRLFHKQLNPGSLYPPAFEVCVYPLAPLQARQRQVRWRLIAAGALLLLGGFSASHFLAGRLSRPVEKLAVDSEQHVAERDRAEAALESTSVELQRAARFSADASHQLKTPVAVLRAGLEELHARENFTPEASHEVSALIRQTHRLSSVIDDLLLLSRLDAGRLKLQFTTVNLSRVIDAALDDLGAQPDVPALEIESDYPDEIAVAGEKRYLGLILQNLLENARKYNRPGGRVRLSAAVDGGAVALTIGNTGQGVSPAAQAHIFERFHRGAIGENVPGYGLGLNLARELARLHQGDLVLRVSRPDWTEFVLRFPAASSFPDPAGGAA